LDTARGRGVADWLVERLGQHAPTPINKRWSQIDPLLPFLIGPMNGRNAQIAVVPRRLGERAKSTCLLDVAVGAKIENFDEMLLARKSGTLEGSEATETQRRNTSEAG